MDAGTRLVISSAFAVLTVLGQGPPGINVERITITDGNHMPPAWNNDGPPRNGDNWNNGGGDFGGPRIGTGVEWGGNNGGGNWGGNNGGSWNGPGDGDSWGNGGHGGGNGNWGEGNGPRGGGSGGRGGGRGDGDGGRGGGRGRGNGGGRGNDNNGGGGDNGGGNGNWGEGNGPRGGGSGGRGGGRGDGDGGRGGGRGGNGGGRGGDNGGGRGGENNGGGGRGGNGGNRPTTTTARPATTPRRAPTTTRKATPAPKPGIGWFQAHFVPINRLWSSKFDKHHFHTNQGLLGQWRANTFADEHSIGQIISVTAYSQNKKSLDWGCEDLVLLQAVEKRATWTEIMHTNGGIINDRIGTGFARLPNIGYCVSKPACGATKPLRYIRRNDGNNFVYTTDGNEFNILNNQDAKYRGGGSGIICYLW